MTDAAMLAPVPVPDAESEPWWTALGEGRFCIARCTTCRRWQHPPLERCRSCAGPTSLEPVSGRGSVFSFVVVRHQAVPGHVPPYVIGVVELVEQAGLRLSAVINADPDEVTIGAPVAVRIQSIGDTGFTAPTFDLEGEKWKS